MDLNLPVTLTVIALIGVVFAFANWRARQPAEPLKVRLVTPSAYNVIQIGCIVALLLMAAHLVTLWTGHPMTGQQPGGRPF
jgi:hypothetical protein